MAAYLWRINQRTLRSGWVGQLSQQRSAQAFANVATVEFFGVFTRFVASTGQGGQSTSASGSVTASAAPIATGQGGQSTSAAGNTSVTATIATGQGGQSAHGAGLVPVVAAIATGQGSQSSSIAASFTSFQSIVARGWLDGAIETSHAFSGLWRSNPRSSSLGLTAQLALSAVARDEMFGAHNWYSYADGFGVASIAYGVQTAAPAGIAAGAIGSASVENQNRVLLPSAIASAEAFGTAFVENLTRYLVPPGFGGEEIGDQLVYTTTQWIYGDGLEPTQWGLPAIANFNMALYPSGFGAPAFGLPALANNTRFVAPPRIDPGSFGTAEIVGPRYVAASGFTELDYGVPDLVGPRSVRPSGISSSAYGSPAVTYLNRSLTLTGIPASIVGFNTRVALGNSQFVYPDPIDEPEFFEPIIGNSPYDVVEAESINDGAFGDALVEELPPTDTPTTRYVRPPGLPLWYLAVGTPRMNPVQLKPNGISAINFGKPSVSNFKRFLSPAGVTGIKFGTQWVSNFIRNVYPPGFDKSVVWDEFGPIDINGVAANVRNAFGDNSGAIGVAGFDHSAVGTPVIDYGLRALAPNPIAPPFFQVGTAGVQSVGQIRASGWDSSEFGDVQEWEAGKIKTQGADMSTFGRPRMSHSFTAGGFDAALYGAPRVRAGIRPDGITGAIGELTITHADNMDFICGTAPRAIPTAGFTADSYGTAYVSFFPVLGPDGIGPESFGLASFMGPRSLLPAGIVPGPFGETEAIGARALLAFGPHSETFGVAVVSSVRHAYPATIGNGERGATYDAVFGTAALSHGGGGG